MNLRLTLFATLALAAALRADSTINPINAYAWSGNVGWINSRADGAHGAVIGEYVCSGYLYAANAGWISLGSGTPVNGIQYQNDTASDFGVNQDGLGNLRGYAYAANAGWFNFESLGAPKVDLLTGRLSGFVYGANAGWLSLSNAVAFVQTDRIAPGADSDGDGIADAFEYFWTGGLTAMNATSDFDRDGASDLQEYLAGTIPIDPKDNLRLTSFTVGTGGTNAVVTWTTQPTRFYYLQQRPDFTTNSLWLDTGLGLIIPNSGTNITRALSGTTGSQRFLRVEAVRPLSP